MYYQGKLGQNVIIWHLKGYSQVTHGVCVCVCFRRKAKDSAGSQCWWCWQRRTCCCLTVCHTWENTGSARHTPTLCLPHGTHTHSVTALILLVHTNTPLKSQSRYTHLHSLLFNTCLFTHTLFACQLAVLTNWELKYTTAASWKETVQKHYSY